MTPPLALLLRVWLVRLVSLSRRFIQSFLGASLEHSKYLPDGTLSVKSTSSKRYIRVNVYEPKDFCKHKTYPVHVNFHGSGFILLHKFGADAEFCRLVSDQTGAIVLDADYAKAPENPFPAAPNDVKDILDYVVANAEGCFDTSRITIGGFSAGGTLALTAGVNQPQGTLKGVVAMYPCADLSLEHAINNPPTVSKGNKNPISPAFNRLVRKCYVSPGTNLLDPRLSPIHTPVSALPKDVLIVVCEEDPLRYDAVKLACRLREEGLNVTLKEMEKVVHSWDKTAKSGTTKGDAKMEAYKTAVNMLNSVYDSIN